MTIKPDVIVVQPDNVDFAMWRSQMAKHRELFNKLIVCFSPSNYRINIKGFVSTELSKIDATILDYRVSTKTHDWRSIAVNACLNTSTSERVLFLEQDFICSDGFLDEILVVKSPLIGFKENQERVGRLHPAFILVERGLVENTCRNFSAAPPKFDHFGLVSEELEAQVVPHYLEDLVPGRYEHLNGLTHNYALLMLGKEPNFRRERFKEYNKEVLELGIEIAPEFKGFVEAAAKMVVEI